MQILLTPSKIPHAKKIYLRRKSLQFQQNKTFFIFSHFFVANGNGNGKFLVSPRAMINNFNKYEL